MRIVVSGAGGFVGSRLVGELAAHEVVALDNMPGRIPDLPNVTPVVGDLCDSDVLADAFAFANDIDLPVLVARTLSAMNGAGEPARLQGAEK